MGIRRRLRQAGAKRLRSWVRARHGEDSLPLTITRQRTYILPTRAGIGLGVLLTFMLLAGLNYGNNLALLSTFLMMGFVLVGMNLCHRNLQGMRVVSVVTCPGFAGEHGRIELTLEAGGPLTRWAVDVDIDGAIAALDHIHGDSSARAMLTVPTPRRGRQTIDRIRLSSSFPFGLFRAWTWLHLPLEIIVYPAARGSLPLPAGADGADAGQAESGPGIDEWSGIRPFRDGDSPRQVIWTAYARELPLLVKEYAGAAADWLRLDYERLTGLDTEQRLQQISRWILDAELRGTRYGLALPGRVLAADSGGEHRERCLRTLAIWPDGEGRR